MTRSAGRLLAPVRMSRDLPALLSRYGPRLCVLPNGPQVIPTLR
ncbi:MAG: hypothetical protein ABIQ99_08975 [Thermoflexales bacterium]